MRNFITATVLAVILTGCGLSSGEQTSPPEPAPETTTAAPAATIPETTTTTSAPTTTAAPATTEAPAVDLSEEDENHLLAAAWVAKHQDLLLATSDYWQSFIAELQGYAADADAIGMQLFCKSELEDFSTSPITEMIEPVKEHPIESERELFGKMYAANIDLFLACEAGEFGAMNTHLAESTDYANQVTEATTAHVEAFDRISSLVESD